MSDVSSYDDDYCNAEYWNSRYTQLGDTLYDWFQSYSALRPIIRNYLPSSSSTVLVVGCGTSVMSEDMVKDGYEDIMNIDISSVAIDMMRTRNKHIPQLKYKQMDVKDMSLFTDESFDGIIDKGTLDSLMCGSDALISAPQMLGEVSRLLKPGGVYIMITYGDPIVRVPHLSRAAYNWNTTLYIQPRPEFQRPKGCSSSRKSYLEPVPVTECGFLPAEFVMEDPDSHFIYVSEKNKRNISI